VGISYNSRTGLKALTMSKDIGFLTGGAGTSTSISFASPTYVPTMTMPLNNYSVTLDATLGLAIFGIHPNVTFDGYYSKQTLATHTLSLPAFGYMYADSANANPYALYDFNREKDLPFVQHIANLPITNFTYDLFSINGQGIEGQFRPFRGDVGVLYDHECSDQSQSGIVGVELGFTEVSHTAVELSDNICNTTTDEWKANNDFIGKVHFKGLQLGNINYEPFYMKSVGEKTVNDTSYYKTIGNTAPMMVQLDQSGQTVTARNIFDLSGSTLLVSGNLTKTRREKRSQSTSILSAYEANFMGLDKTINSYPLNTSVFGNCGASASIYHISRLYWPQHHMSEITVTNPDGKRYVYGLPAYNTRQQEVTFSVNTGINTSISNYYLSDSVNLVTYDTNVDNSISNTKGLDNYFNQQELPSYSHSFLLTGILSSDYVDLTGDGITDDDLGEAVKFNYTQVYSKAKPYRWRSPFELGSAAYQIGLMSYSPDDKANYTYGEKEIWYSHSIESKTMVAQFILEDRQDGFGVKNKNGGIDSKDSLKCLKEIDLYSKADLIKNGANAVPIKTVHFEYCYSLCPGTPNSLASGGGKLTLTRVYFTYGNNTEGSLNSYKFTYPTSAAENPGYSHNHYDRWGYYKYNPAGMPPTEDFPYTLQDSVRTNQFATAWNLTGIDLPSGGHITVNYESNDYAYVQNQRATQMFIIKGVGFNPNDSTGSDLYNFGLPLTNGSLVHYNNWIFVKLPTAVSNVQDFHNKYLANIDSATNKLYFRFLTNVGNFTTPSYEYVPGYADIDSIKVVNPHLGAIKLNMVNSNDPFVGNANPVSIASWQFARLNLPQIAYPGSQITGSPLSIIEGLLGIIPEVIDIFTGFDQRAVLQNFGKYIVPSHSYIRLDNPIYKKYGGGTRVKEIDISDNWSDMVNGQSTFQYGQTFNYTKTSANGQFTISSGVATYEPLIGGDENPLRQPLPYTEQYLLAPNNRLYTETPLGETLFPSPQVVYSQVTVTNLKHDGVIRTGTGYTINRFYTAYDFPVQTGYTGAPKVNRITSSPLLSIFSIGVQDFMNTSEGFAVEVNDMPGKEKSQEIYDQNKSLISSISYSYKVDNSSVPSMHLNNDVQVINPTGAISTASVGKDIDVWEDMREQDTQSTEVGITPNFEAMVVPFGIIPLFLDILALCPSYATQHTRFRSAVTTKYIHRTGLLDHVTKIQNGATITSQNILYDGETGEVLLTKTNNEFNQPIYSFNYPAHWAYDGMGSAYQNIEAMLELTTRSTGTISSPSLPATYFTSGDEIEYSTPSGLVRGWITEPQDSLMLMDRNGNPVILNNTIVKVIRSGRRNMPATPVCEVTSMLSPAGKTKLYMKDSLQILQANATEYNDLWQIPYTSVEAPVCKTISNPADTCLEQFLDSIITNHQLFATPLDSIYPDNDIRGRLCSDLDTGLYFALTGPTGMDQLTNFQAQIGNSILTISSVSGSPIFFDSLNPLYTNAIVGPRHISKDSINANGCLNLWIDRDPSHRLEDMQAVLVATACVTTTTCHDSCENLAVNSIVNPYVQGMKGDWRPQRNYIYYDTRSPALASTQSNIWNTGIFNHFNQIWDPPASGSSIWPLDTSDKNWTWPSIVTMYDQKGNEIESKDILGDYSSMLFGYVQSLQVAASSNARYKDIAFDGFEDYGFTPTCNAACDNTHFSFMDYISDTTSTQAHTGKYSLKINAGSYDSVSRPILYLNGAIDSTTASKYYLLKGGNIPLFSPDSGSYLLSAWVKESTTCGVTGYIKDSIVVSFTSSSAKYVMKPSGPVIEGWQRFESRFKVPGAAKSIIVKLVAGSNTAYYDDIRIEPFAAEMTSYVYDPSSLRLLATLDENNYATFYEYNDEGILLRVKKETERGIMTIKESRSSYPRKLLH